MPKNSIAKKKFKKTIDNYWECQVIENGALCNSKLKQNKGSTSNLVKHLNNSHNGMYEKMKNGLIPVDDEFENQELLNSKDPDTLLMLHTASSFLSFNSLNSPYFKRFVDVISEGRYKVPHRTTIASKILDTTYNKVIEEIINYTKQCKALAITTDGWCDNSTTHFWSLTISGIDERLNIESKVLALQPVYSDFSSFNVGNILLDILKDTNIELNKIGFVVTDDGGACPNIHSILGLRDYICSGHRLQNVIKNSFSEVGKEHQVINTIITVVKSLIRKYKKSYKVKNEITGNNPKLKTLKQSCSTRWNSLYYSIKSVMKAKTEVRKYIKDHEEKLP